MAEKLYVALIKKKTAKTFFSWNITVVIYTVWLDKALQAKDQKTLHYYWPPTNCKLKIFLSPSPREI